LQINEIIRQKLEKAQLEMQQQEREWDASMKSANGSETESIPPHIADEGEEESISPNSGSNFSSRRSSLSTSSETSPNSTSPRHNKSVKFADSAGMKLANYKTYIKQEEPMFCGRTNFKKALLANFHLDSRLAQSPSPPSSSSDDASEISSDDSSSLSPSLANSSTLDSKNPCRLIKIETEYPIVRGSIRVENLEYRKHVFVRFTKNHWLTFDELTAYYVKSEAIGKFDIFTFEIDLQKSFLVGQQVEFAVCFHALSSARFFWDNNGGLNYHVECILQIKDSMKR
jgi:hypothetical protein